MVGRVTDKSAAKRRRAARNRLAREAREARTERAKGATTTPAGADGRKGRRPRPKRSGSFLDDQSEFPGRRMAGLATLVAVSASAMLLFFPLIGVETDRIEDGEEVVENVSLWSELGPSSLLVVAVPIAVCLTALAFSRRPGRTRVLVAGAVAQAAFIAFAPQIGLLYLFSAGALGIGAWQSRKADKARAEEPTTTP